MIARSIYDQACDWIVRLDSDAVSAADRSEFVRWLNRSPDHAAAYQEMSRLWARLDTLSLARPESFLVPAEMPAIEDRRSPWYLGYRGAMAASLAVIALIIGTVVITDPVRELDQTRQFVTPIDQGYEFTAPDGSLFRLGSLTSVALNFTRSLRAVELTEGKLDVTVQHDARRPFTVGVGAYEVRALGTRFEVERSAQEIDLKVFEGQVRFGPRPEKPQEITGGFVLPADRATFEVGRGQSLSWRFDTGDVLIETPGEEIPDSR